ncbi:MAG: type I restriction enzyme HsdR N-terminal domain-containing protein [Bacteroides sp.]|nr:type I restriction enzyme HsdR N-terminal domain-containing protein [Bacteroides sp.]MCM1095745.1 type I restriction enzyme HsdR N-terminal domain-containing protein [Terasakiella sp.]
MVALNLPSAPLRLSRDDSGVVRVYDPLRCRWLVLTPEEWVRQHFTAYLRSELGYPASLMANEVSLELNGMRRRCDTVVYSREGLRPLLIVEYKRPTVAITATVFDQIARYNSVLGAPWLMVSNGLRHFCCRFDGDGYTFARALPPFSSLI